MSYVHWTRSLKAILCLAITSGAYAEVISDGDHWLQRSTAERSALIEGFCLGAASDSSSNLGLHWCLPFSRENMNKKLGRTPRLCGVQFTGEAVQFVTNFYMKQEHKDLPLWTAFVVYNDRACGEAQLSPAALKLIEAKRKCNRRLMSLMQMKVSEAVLQRQQQDCDAIK